MECSICLGKGANTVTPCRHGFHRACLEQWIDRHPSCPACRALCLPAGVRARLSQESDLDAEYTLYKWIITLHTHAGTLVLTLEVTDNEEIGVHVTFGIVDVGATVEIDDVALMCRAHDVYKKYANPRAEFPLGESFHDADEEMEVIAKDWLQAYHEALCMASLDVA